jgi:hypothetical protein
MKLPKGFPTILIPVIILVSVISVTIGLGCLSMLMGAGWKTPCSRLPTLERAEAVLAEHNDTIEQIKALNPGNVWMDLDSAHCPGKAELLIYYATIYDKHKIKELIGETFFGIPYRMFNV